jgi:hypothetical protein
MSADFTKGIGRIRNASSFIITWHILACLSYHIPHWFNRITIVPVMTIMLGSDLYGAIGENDTKPRTRMQWLQLIHVHEMDLIIINSYRIIISVGNFSAGRFKPEFKTNDCFYPWEADWSMTIQLLRHLKVLVGSLCMWTSFGQSSMQI